MNTEALIQLIETTAAHACSVGAFCFGRVEHSSAEYAEVHAPFVLFLTGRTIDCGIGATRHVAIVPRS